MITIDKPKRQYTPRVFFDNEEDKLARKRELHRLREQRYRQEKGRNFKSGKTYNEYMKEYMQSPKYQAYSKEYYQRPEVKARKLEARKLWAHKNKEKNDELRRKWKEANPEKVKYSWLTYNHKKRVGNKGDVDIPKLVNGWDGNCGICSENVDGSYHIDHIYPISKGGLHTQSNLQLTHPRCNRVKSNKIMELA